MYHKDTYHVSKYDTCTNSKWGYTLISNGQLVTHVLTHHAILELARGNNPPMPTWPILVIGNITSTKATRKHTKK